MKTYATIIGIVKFQDKILLLKRTSKRTSSPDKWQPVSGFIKEREPAEDAVLREVKEETGLDGTIEKKGEVFEISDDYGRWIIMPFLVSVNSDNVEIDPKEHSEYSWVKLKEIYNFDLIAGVIQDLKSVDIL
ncbi:NUDIX domain-containing protein [Patescibacteria group bacterium]|nr:NUDIX domain-containing protein [Patescibacteria group bacterium]